MPSRVVTLPFQLQQFHHHQQQHLNEQQEIPRFTILYALRRGYFNLIRHLLANGADPNQADTKDKFHRTPLIYCTFIKDDNWALSIAQNLLEHGADLQICDLKGLTALHYCCTFNKHKLLNLFLNSLDFDLLNTFDLNGNTCLHYATRFCHLKCIRLILNKCKQYNSIDVDLRNSYGFRPSDLLNEPNNNLSKDLNEKCKLILKNYEKNILPGRKSFDNIVEMEPISSAFQQLQQPQQAFQNENTINNSDINHKNRPITAPVFNLNGSNSQPDSNKATTNEGSTLNGSISPTANSIYTKNQSLTVQKEATDMTNKQKISFQVIPPSPSVNTCSSQYLKNASLSNPVISSNLTATSLSTGLTATNSSSKRPMSTQSHKLYRFNTLHQTNSTADDVKNGNYKAKKLKNVSAEVQLLLDSNELIHNSIIFSDLCANKEYIVYPKNSLLKNESTLNLFKVKSESKILNNAHQNEQLKQSKQNQLPPKPETEAPQTNHQLPVTPTKKSIIKQRHSSNQSPVPLSQPTQKIQSPKEQQEKQQPPLLQVPPNKIRKSLRTPSLTIVSGRQSRQSFFTGYLTSNSGMLATNQQNEHGNVDMLFDQTETEDVFQSNFTSHQNFNINIKETIQQQQLQQQQREIELNYEVYTGWKRYMRSLLNELEFKESASYRKSIQPPLNTYTTTPTDLNSSDFSDKLKNVGQRQVASQKQTKRISRQSSAVSASQSQLGFYSNTNSLLKKSKH